MAQSIMIVGRLTAAPVLRHTSNGTPVCSFTLAENRNYKVDGESRQKTTYINCTQWGAGGEATARYGAKGRLMTVSGELNNRSYASKAFIRRDSLALDAGASYTGAQVLGMLQSAPGANQQATELNVRTVEWCDANPNRQAAAPAVPTAAPAIEVSEDENPF